MHVLRKAPARDVLTESPTEFVLSDATVDRMGDVIDPHGWDLREFRTNPIALLNHDPHFPIGTWENVGVINNQLRGHLKLAPEGTSPRIDEVRKLVTARVLRSTSVGFRPIEYKPRVGAKGTHYLKQSLLETSLVSIPANASATLLEAKRVEARALGVSSSSIDKIFRQSHNATAAERQATARRKLAAIRDAEEAANLKRASIVADKIAAYRAEIKRVDLGSYSTFGDHDYVRKLQNDLNIYERAFALITERV